MCAERTFVSDRKCALGGRLCPTKSVRWVDVRVRRKVCAEWTFVHGGKYVQALKILHYVSLTAYFLYDIFTIVILS